MKALTFTAVAGTIVAGGLLVGCASAPSDQVTAAQEALRNAETVQADRYVADLYQAAQDSFAAAQTEIEHQNGQFMLSRDYDRAEQLLQFVTETATTASAQVEERKVTMRTETETLIDQAQQALAMAQELLTKAPRTPESNVALVALTENTSSAQSTLNDAVLALEQDDIATAHQLAQSALGKANNLVQELNNTLAQLRS